MREITITTNKVNHLIDPHLSIWGWEVPVYLFAGGLAAGTLIIASLAIIYRKEKELPTCYSKVALFGPVILTLGMTALFFDLEYKAHVFRFYTTFQVTSPMSWGSWTLLLFYPLSIILTLSTLEQGWPSIYKRVGSISVMQSLVKFSKKHMRLAAHLSFPVAIFLGLYTGILLSAYVGRPLWNSAILGPVFLVSGFSTALALVLLVSKDRKETHFISRIDLIAIIVELVLVTLYLYNLATSTSHTLEAAKLFMGGPFSIQFWVAFVGLGLVVPLLLEAMEIRGKRIPVFLPASLVIFGGLMFRFLMVEAGQVSTWVHY